MFLSELLKIFPDLVECDVYDQLITGKYIKLGNYYGYGTTEKGHLGNCLIDHVYIVDVYKIEVYIKR